MGDVIWERDGETFHATLESTDGTTRFHFVVERLNHGWDWTVWRPDDPVASARHGVADTVQEAMRQAEEASGDPL
jgi:hypothetical protein